MALFEKLGFHSHPFEKTNADEEPHLADYFVPPPFFDSVIGDPKTPNSCVVIAPRGGGKTAQRRMLEHAATERKYLPVTYDRFEFSGGQELKDISLQYHLRNIITRLLISYLSYLADYPDLLKNLEQVDRRRLSVFVYTYLGELSGDSLQEILKELKGLPERFKNFWRDKVGFLESLVNLLLNHYGLDKIDLPDVKQEEKKLTETYKHQLEYLFHLVSRLGYDSVYILLDKLDETEKTGNDPERAYTLIRPLLRDLDLLGLKGYAFKFFLWDQIEPYYRVDARPDRVHQYDMSWTRKALVNILSKRLKAFSNGNILSFKQSCREDLNFDADSAICLLSMSSPRNVIRICERILAVQSERDIDADSISLQAFDQGILNYCDQIGRELYGEETLRDFQRIGRELFTVNYIANDIFKVTQNAVRNKITSWLKSGIIRQIGTVSVQSSKRPLNFYCVVDPAVVRLIHRDVSFEEFLNDRWLPCDFCQTDNLMDINYFPGENDPVCINCGRSSF